MLYHSFAYNSLSRALSSDFGKGLPHLEELNLWDNDLFGRIPSTISNASKLTSLEMSENKFSGIIPHSLGDLRYLERLNIYSNKLIVTDASSSENNFLSSLTNCRNLKAVDFSMNPLYIKLPKSIGNFSYSLRYLIAEQCGINGNIPLEIGNLASLIELSLNGNDLSGSIPFTIGNLKRLQYLNFQQNKLQGSNLDKLC